jgi:hypothetical protein
MNYIIDLPGCLGDILFTLKIAEEYSKTGDVYWNVFPVFWNSGINRIISSANIGPNQPTYLKGAQVIKLRDLTVSGDIEIMRKKYTSVGMDWSDWADYVKYDRNHDIENSLRLHLNIEKGDPFILYNDTYSFNNKHNGVINSIPKDYDGKLIKMQIFENLTIFDWCWIFENAEEIHTVDTSILCVIETLNLKCTKMTCHPRNYWQTILAINNLFKKPWQFIEYDRDEWRKYVPGGNEGEFLK